MKNMTTRGNLPPFGIITLAGILMALLPAACRSPVNAEADGFAISIRETAHGTVSAGRQRAQAGETVTLDALPDERHKLASVRITGVSGFAVIPDKWGNACSFTMPAEDVIVSAVFVAADLKNYAITVNPMENGTFNAVPEDSQYDGCPVSLTAAPYAGYKYRPGSLRIRAKKSREDISKSQEKNSAAEWTFMMPSEDVEIDAAFIDENTALYDITIEHTVYGAVECGQSNAVAGDEVALALQPEDGCRYRGGSLSVTANDGELIEIFEAGGKKWFFIMPEKAVCIRAEFEEIPSFAVIPADIDYGIISVEPSQNAREGTEIIITLSAHDPENYRYVKNSFAVTGADSGNALDFAPQGDCSWSFAMPAEAVKVSAALELIPWYNIAVNSAGNGGFAINGAAAGGSYAGKAREGAVITVTAIPDPGYKLAGAEPSVAPPGAVSLAKLEAQPSWVFNMGNKDIEIGVVFTELDTLEIYKGGLRKGIRVGEMEGGYAYYENAVELDAEIPVNGGFQKVLKIKAGLNANGNAVQHSFCLISDAEIDLENASALSFRARANTKLDIRFAGFGGNDPNKRVAYTGENYDQKISVGTEWQRYFVPVPVPDSGLNITRAFIFGALISKGNYVYVDDIEFIQGGVTLSGIQIAQTSTELFYGATDAEKILKGSPIKLSYACADGTTVTLRNASNKHQVKYNLAHWLAPYVMAGGNIVFSNGQIIPQAGNSRAALTVSVSGKISNPMTVNILDGLLLDDFEDTGKVNIPGTPASAAGYLWHTLAGGSVITRDYLSDENAEIHGGLAAGNWRPGANANNPRGGRNFDAKDLGGYNTLIFRIRVTRGTAAGSDFCKNTAVTFGLRNGGTLASKSDGFFYEREFIYETDGWQEVKMKLADFIDIGLDPRSVTGYAFCMVEKQNTALRIALDDIAAVNE
ncbi:MAG: hypothetical protein LBG95_00075 [Treponema sp.]|jgi:hypothetical protein|nr:hypothetical protein [Treponema sp.]